MPRTIKENKILSGTQKSLISGLPADIRQGYVLTGGTALSAFYLQHRFSEDLDFFAISEGNDLVQSVIESKLLEAGLKITGRDRIHDRKIFFIESEGIMLKVEFVPLYFRRLEEPVFIDGSIYIEALNDMIANKVIALTDRFEIKDFVDIYYIALKHDLSIRDMIQIARKKYDTNYEYLVRLSRINDVKDTALDPVKVIGTLNIDTLKKFFLDSERLIVSGKVTSMKKGDKNR